MRFFGSTILLIVLFLAPGVQIPGQTGPTPLEQRVEQLFALPSPTGFEHPTAQMIQEHFSDQARFSYDNLGSLYLAPFSGSADIAVVAGMDEIGYVVSGITEQGYLTLDRGVNPGHDLYDTFQFGHPVKVWTTKGPVNGVWILPSSHTLSSERRRNIMQEFTLENVFVDIGAGSRIEVEKRGVRFLDPVTPAADIHVLAGGKFSGPAMGTKACAALLLDLSKAAETMEFLQSAEFVWMAQTKLVRRTGGRSVAIGALRARKGITSPRVILIDTYPCAEDALADIQPGQGPVLTGPDAGSPWMERIKKTALDLDIPLQEAADHTPAALVPFLDEKLNTAALLIPVKYSATPSEVIWLSDLEAVQRLVKAVVGRGGAR